MKNQIARLLASREQNRIMDDGLIPSAVLFLLFKKGTDYHVLFTKRSDKVAHHKGEISFPGGTVDPGDADRLHTALREGREEIGISPRDITILGRLDDMVTVTTGFVISPFVGTIPYPYQFAINRDEIAELIFAPLETLVEQYGTAAAETPEAERTSAELSFHVRGNIIWGATARILRQFLDLLLAI